MILRLFMALYRLLWLFGLPFVLLYLWRRGRRDPAYLQALPERFGFYRRALPQGALWVHAVSLGEMRSALALVRRMLDRGETVVLTHFTPAGRSESARAFGPEIAAGRVVVVWVPLDMGWCWRRFLRACRPRLGLTLEVEIWPAMITAARAAGVPLFAANAIYTQGRFARDSKGLRLRQRVIAQLSGAFVKSRLQAERFAATGLTGITVTGELRFDQPVPPALPAAAARLRPALAAGREVITLASCVEAEEPLFTGVIAEITAQARAENRPAPLFVHVPRAPERFDAVATGLAAAGLNVLRRSAALGPDLAPLGPITAPDVFLGDSLGEMFFYLALADRVIVGGGFSPKGAHNVIEPLMLGKPVLTGPQVHTIEYPFAEAAAAGVAQSLPDRAALLAALAEPPQDNRAAIVAFLAEHAGASARTLAAADAALARLDLAARPGQNGGDTETAGGKP
ncbi:3-deoxy-D-manno-octulosonic acid transferase [Rhodobacter capsulatus]|uniref:3-deoxy-D-manno-octulosonic acid transferase n=1 Tax=Rhodobacter capsulatus TaxID=1061 RepID=UPI0003D2CCED|nr:glycosyltransferase N-terminal domain-containing protein [Rhodobacter capsulatus]ETD89812.1 3-deoxy-D-manno-octulosonic acid transferase [Rhodobacter capsulatus YW2]